MPRKFARATVSRRAKDATYSTAIYFPKGNSTLKRASSSRETSNLPGVSPEDSPQGNVQSKDPYSRIAGLSTTPPRPDQFPVTQPEPVRGNTSLSNKQSSSRLSNFSPSQPDPHQNRPHFSPDRPPSSFPHRPTRKPSQESPITPVGRDPLSDPPTRAEAIRPDLNPSQGRMCVAVDFGTVLSGVACGQSSDTVQQILWPGPNRK
ncbi:hypothetical protein BS47DRAFT_1370119, partial [Hydnum rufescens UP504]